MNAIVSEMPNPFRAAKIVAENVSPEVYLRQAPEVKRGDLDFVMSRGELMTFRDCPHKWLMGYERDDTKATDWGSGVDCLLLAPNQWEQRFAVKPKTYPAPATHADVKKGLIQAGDPLPWNGNATVCKEWLAAQDGKTLFSDETATQLQNAIKFLWGDPIIAEIVKCSSKQVMVLAEYHDKDTGYTIPVKALLDLVPSVKHPEYRKVLLDLKTAANASEGAWVKAVFDHDYDAQAALFMDAYTVATGEDRTDFWHIVQESCPPWESVIWRLSDEFIQLGRMKYTDALVRYCQCLKSNHWPGYCDSPRWISPKPYMVQ